jgi:hypothetical protein
MVTLEQGDELILAALHRVKGLATVVLLAEEDRQKIRDIEAEVEAKSLLGLGKVINAGVQGVLECDWVYVGLTNMDFDWDCHSNLVMKKGNEVVGEEVRDKETIDRLSTCENVWFLHKNFVVYKDRVSFPQDVMKKICYFEIPCHPANWSVEVQCHSILYCSPSTPCDVFLKNRYFQGMDTKGEGTVLIGIKL